MLHWGGVELCFPSGVGWEDLLPGLRCCLSWHGFCWWRNCGDSGWCVDCLLGFDGAPVHRIVISEHLGDTGPTVPVNSTRRVGNAVTVAESGEAAMVKNAIAIGKRAACGSWIVATDAPWVLTSGGSSGGSGRSVGHAKVRMPATRAFAGDAMGEPSGKKMRRCVKKMRRCVKKMRRCVHKNAKVRQKCEGASKMRRCVRTRCGDIGQLHYKKYGAGIV